MIALVSLLSVYITIRHRLIFLKKMSYIQELEKGLGLGLGNLYYKGQTINTELESIFDKKFKKFVNSKLTNQHLLIGLYFMTFFFSLMLLFFNIFH
ncbi:hypothetical protein MCHI_000556 [Candidatus Magnetoovum chiemensis]|nr:hypothetical protein MCHI_000556 [Candidatus Magnetoovum chiemensis]